MKAYLAVSLTPEGSKAAVGKFIGEDNDYRIEVYDSFEEAQEVCDNMTKTFAGRGMAYYVCEIML